VLDKNFACHLVPKSIEESKENTALETCKYLVEKKPAKKSSLAFKGEG
jgi:hypothetical protein